MKTQEFKILGMTCAACVRTVEKSITKIEGVSSVNVNLMTEKAVIHYDSDKVQISDLKRAIQDAGYTPLDIEKIDIDQERKEKEIKTIWNQFIFSAIFTLPLLYIAMGPMIGIPIPSFNGSRKCDEDGTYSVDINNSSYYSRKTFLSSRL